MMNERVKIKNKVGLHHNQSLDTRINNYLQTFSGA